MKSKKKDSCSIPPLRSGVLIADAVGKANILNRQYSSVFTLEDTNNIPSKGHSIAPPMPNIKIIVEGVKRMLQELKPQKAPGPDKISTRVLKELAEPLPKPLTEFFQHSIDSGVVPTQWKKALVTPISKKGDKHCPANYRPVSLTAVQQTLRTRHSEIHHERKPWLLQSSKKVISTVLQTTNLSPSQLCAANSANTS